MSGVSSQQLPFLGLLQFALNPSFHTITPTYTGNFGFKVNSKMANFRLAKTLEPKELVGASKALR